MYKHAILALATASGLLAAAEPASARSLPVDVTYCGGQDAIRVDVPPPADDLTVGELRERLVAMARSWAPSTTDAPVRALAKWHAPSGTSLYGILLDGLRACRGIRAEQDAADAADTTDTTDATDATDDDMQAYDLGMLGSPGIATMLETLVADPPACWPTAQAETDEETDEEIDEETDAYDETDADDETEIDEETDVYDETDADEQPEAKSAGAHQAALLDAIGLRQLLDAVLAGPVTCAPGTASTSLFAAPKAPVVPLVAYEPSLMDRLGLSAALDRVQGG